MSTCLTVNMVNLNRSYSTTVFLCILAAMVNLNRSCSTIFMYSRCFPRNWLFQLSAFWFKLWDLTVLHEWHDRSQLARSRFPIFKNEYSSSEICRFDDDTSSYNECARRRLRRSNGRSRRQRGLLLAPSSRVFVRPPRTGRIHLYVFAVVARARSENSYNSQRRVRYY